MRSTTSRAWASRMRSGGLSSLQLRANVLADQDGGRIAEFFLGLGMKLQALCKLLHLRLCRLG